MSLFLHLHSKLPWLLTQTAPFPHIFFLDLHSLMSTHPPTSGSDVKPFGHSQSKPPSKLIHLPFWQMLESLKEKMVVQNNLQGWNCVTALIWHPLILTYFHCFMWWIYRVKVRPIQRTLFKMWWITIQCYLKLPIHWNIIL